MIRFFPVLIGLLISSCIKGEEPETNTIPALHSEFQKELNVFQKKSSVKGIAVAIFDSEEIIWEHVQGKSTYGFPVNDSTMFSLQSVSKNITALSVMIALEEGLLDLDTPISKYLSEFKVNSCFEENPESKITLRILLSHTAGFPHEAPVGNNYDYSFPSIEKHLESIGESWLKFPVGTKYSYSNLGFDLAAQIVEKVSGIPYDIFLKTRVFNLLGMNNSTVNDQVFVNTKNKTEGIDTWVKSNHYPIPLIGSGAAYSTLSDMVKYVQFHMNLGKIDGKRLINQNSLHEMYSVEMNNYGLGTYVDSLLGTYYLNHNGGGFGYGCSMVWIPKYNIGCVVLANKYADCFSLAISIIEKYIGAVKMNIKNDSLVANEFNPFAQAKVPVNQNAIYQCTVDSVYKNDWSQYTGSYEVMLGGMDFKWYAKLAFALGKKPVVINVSRIDDSLFLSGSFGESKLFEYQEGLFFTLGGASLDLRSYQPTFANLKLSKFK